ncbi:Leucine--tRNA ligase, cytoplasmic [Frankliniella fusca]|uniref:Leucine--tRNA ligase, cytoplasmic n=1 Tax=Frankliniella fusca TaxID=407009 RepID=A0AAE1I2B0_9NEOP|nr:Leucine--tRNA ligase, cytoplasmic [Frankliniella fusca]
MQRYDHPDVFIFSSDPENRCSQTPPHENELLILPIDAPDDNVSAQDNTGKRPREKYDDDDAYVEPDHKIPHMDFPQSTSPRRSLTSTGAKGERCSKEEKYWVEGSC